MVLFIQYIIIFNAFKIYCTGNPRAMIPSNYCFGDEIIRYSDHNKLFEEQKVCLSNDKSLEQNNNESRNFNDEMLVKSRNEQDTGSKSKNILNKMQDVDGIDNFSVASGTNTDFNNKDIKRKRNNDNNDKLKAKYLKRRICTAKKNILRLKKGINVNIDDPIKLFKVNLERKNK